MSPVTIAWTATGAICPDQFDRIAKMGNIGMSFFTPHVYFWGDEDEVGSLEPGKYADFVVLSDDPLEVDPMAIKDIRIEATVMNGRITYFTANRGDYPN